MRVEGASKPGDESDSRAANRQANRVLLRKTLQAARALRNVSAVRCRLADRRSRSADSRDDRVFLVSDPVLRPRGHIGLVRERVGRLRHLLSRLADLLLQLV